MKWRPLPVQLDSEERKTNSKFRGRRWPLKDFMWQSPMCSMCSMRSAAAASSSIRPRPPPSLLRMIAHVKVAAVLYPLTRVKTFSKSSLASVVAGFAASCCCFCGAKRQLCRLPHEFYISHHTLAKLSSIPPPYFHPEITLETRGEIQFFSVKLVGLGKSVIAYCRYFVAS
jgi:hypothetical protein